MIYNIALFAASLVAVSGRVFTENASQQKFLWEQFKQEYRKTYDANEEPKRFQIFLENLKVVDERNKLDNVHGITKFSDLSQEEFEAHYLGSKPSSKKVNDSLRSTVDHIPSTVGDSTVSWVGKYTTPVKNQGYCGSCWAFSATEQLESDSMRLLGTDYILSPEQVTQCTTGAFGCGGGWTETAYTYIKNAGGLEQDTDYPYTSYFGQTGTCHADSSLEVVTLTGFTTITGSSTSAIETNMANYMLATGPLSVCLDASSWNSYTGGIMKVCGNNVDHCVQAVGVTTGSSGYWNVRNSWGTSWGNAGYIYLAYGANTCDITNDPTYVAAVKSSR